jgi:hypothetical protein
MAGDVKDAGRAHKPRGERLKDVELRTMTGIIRALQHVAPGPRDAIVTVVMQSFSPDDLAALLRVLKLLGGVADVDLAERIRRWVYERYGPAAPESRAPGEEPYR